MVRLHQYQLFGLFGWLVALWVGVLHYGNFSFSAVELRGGEEGSIFRRGQERRTGFQFERLESGWDEMAWAVYRDAYQRSCIFTQLSSQKQSNSS